MPHWTVVGGGKRTEGREKRKRKVFDSYRLSGRREWREVERGKQEK